MEGMQSQGSQSERKKEVNHAKGEHKCKRVCNQAGYSTGQSLRICPQSENTEPWKKLWGLTIIGRKNNESAGIFPPPASHWLKSLSIAANSHTLHSGLCYLALARESQGQLQQPLKCGDFCWSAGRYLEAPQFVAVVTSAADTRRNSMNLF